MTAAQHRRTRTLTWRRASNLLTLALIGAWWFTLGPTALGGPASYIAVEGHSMDGTYATGDLIVLHERDTYRTGQVIAFRAGGGQVIHRIVGGNGRTGYTTQGDNNPDVDPWQPVDSDVLGTTVVRLAGSAHYLDLPSEPWFAGLSAGLLTLLFLVPDGLREALAGRRLNRAPTLSAYRVEHLPAQGRHTPAVSVPQMRAADHDRTTTDQR
jgi:signal peptidase I